MVLVKTNTLWLFGEGHRMAIKLEFTIEVKTTEDQLARGLMRELVKQLNRSLRPLKRVIQADMALAVPKIFVDRDVTGIYSKLVNGPLNLDFGFVKGTEKSRIEEILTQIGKSVRVDYKDIRMSGSGFTISNGFTVKILKDDFLDILGLPAATVLNLSSNPRSPLELPWLDWLLLRGDSIIISDHIIQFKEGVGRSGGAVMISNKGGAWTVPAGSSGTRDDNWLTKEVLDASDFLLGLSSGIVDKHIQAAIG